MSRIRFALAQLNPLVGDLKANASQILSAVAEAKRGGASVVVTPEMSLTGYPVEDLAYDSSFVSDSFDSVNALAADLKTAGLGDVAVVVGLLSPANNPGFGGQIAHNSLAVLHDGKIAASYHKHHLPNYSVFDEARVFVPGENELILNLGGVSTGFLVCEDLWRFEGPVEALSKHDLDAVVVINASPFDTEKDEHRYPLIKKRAAELKSTMLYVNLFGGQDDLVFDGDSCVVSQTGEVLASAKRFEHETLLFDIAGSAKTPIDIALTSPTDVLETKTASPLNDLEEIWLALTIGVRDFVNKNGFKSVVLGVSGGIDSAVCASLAVDAIGADRVYGIAMPSEYSSDHSLKDAEQLCKNTGATYSVQPIIGFVDPIETGLSLSGVPAENLQARIRGLILMAKSNQDGHLVLTTGNKTEISVGYCTMYGDTVGGFAPLKDVPKTLVWELAKWRNRFAVERRETPSIPENSITKPPSAELRPGQLDQDSLPPYEELDQILEMLIDRRIPVSEIVKSGFAQETVERIAGLVAGSEWKRRQGAIGPRITRMAFGRERRLPITVKRSKG